MELTRPSDHLTRHDPSIAGGKGPSLGVIDDWQKLFRVQGLRFLIDDIWMDHYKSLNALSIVINDEYTSYLPRPMLDNALNEGVALLSSHEKFSTYAADFTGYSNNFKDITSTLNYETITCEKTEQLLDLMARFFYFYSKTEFFATDRAYQQYTETNNSTLGENLEQMGKLKNAGREVMNAIFFGSTATYGKLLAALSKRFMVPESDLQQYSRAEIAALFDGVQVPKDDLTARMEAFYMQGVNGSLIVKVGGEARADISVFRGDIKNIESEALRGICGNRGKISGRAFVVRMGYDNFDQLPAIIETMQPGDILIAETTSPEYMLACTKAAAIVTDQGGLLSHAAIISRELGIPCLLGTTTATELFKTGDPIEVDADKGVVRKVT